MDGTALKVFLLALFMCLGNKLAETSAQGSSEAHLFPSKNKLRSLQNLKTDSNSRSHISTAQTKPGQEVKIRQFNIESIIFFHFATVTIKSEVINTFDHPKEIDFKVQVSENAFLSSFSMILNGKKIVSRVMDREEARKYYNEAKAHNQSAGHVEQDVEVPEREMQFFRISVSLEANASAFFALSYKEHLEKINGVYRQKLVVQPGKIVPDLVVNTTIRENQGLQMFTYRLPGNKTWKNSGSERDGVRIQKNDSRFLSLVWRPTVLQQRNADPEKGVSGELIIVYNTSIGDDAGVFFFQKKYFVHSFAPKARGLGPLQINYVFIIDISGSMGIDGKIAQSLEAMLVILDHLNESKVHLFNILLFNDKLRRWREGPSLSTSEAISSAKKFCQNMMANPYGGTDIHSALMEGLDMVFKGRDKKSNCSNMNVIIFMSDGDPTHGETSTNEIIADVNTRNKKRVIIHTLGLGVDMRFDFLEQIAYLSYGYAYQIYIADDLKDQLEKFYRSVSEPKLCNVQLEYNKTIVSQNDLTKTKFPVYYQGREILAAGRLSEPVSKTSLDALSRTVAVRAVASEGKVAEYHIPGGKVQRLEQSPDVEDLPEKFWAYLKIKDLLKQMKTMEAGAERELVRSRALNLSLKYGFVTPLTSFAVVLQDRPDIVALPNRKLVSGSARTTSKMFANILVAFILVCVSGLC